MESINVQEAAKQETLTPQEIKYLESLTDHKFLGIISQKILTSNCSNKHRIIIFLKLLNSQNIDIRQVQNQASLGIPDDYPMLRSLVWKILMQVLPLNSDLWEETLDEKRNNFNKIKERITVKLEFDKKKRNSKKQKLIDHPLNQQSGSVWKSYFEDLDLLEEVEKDIRRTKCHVDFFSKPAKKEKIILSENEEIELIEKKKTESTVFDRKLVETNSDIMSRILFIYAKEHKEVKYVQGMNEILAPIYYCFSLDTNPYFYLNLEADAYFLFEKIMSKIKDIYIRANDNSDTGINNRLRRIFELLKTLDKDLYLHFASEKIESNFFAFRWYTLFFTQEFEFTDILRIWDTIFANENIYELLTFLCLGVLKLKRTELIKNDFSGIMMCLQNLQKISAEELIDKAFEISSEYFSKSNK